MFMVVDVLSNEKCGLKDVQYVLGGGGCGVSVWVNVVMVDLVKENLCGLWIVNVLNSIRWNLFAFGRQICMKYDCRNRKSIMMDERRKVRVRSVAKVHGGALCVVW